MSSKRFAAAGVMAALALWAAQAGACRAQGTGSEPGRPSGAGQGSPVLGRPAEPPRYYAAPRYVPVWYNTGYSPIFMTTINTPGVYGAYSMGVANQGLFNREPLFSPADNPRRRIPSVNVTVVPPRTDSTELSVRELRPESGTATIRVLVPADARLTFQGAPTTPTGTSREFVTPALPVGRHFTYDVQATWNDSGRPVTRERQVVVRAGDRLNIDMTNAPVAESTLRAAPLPLPPPEPGTKTTTPPSQRRQR
jgi:uncharacterized protein (TIGR03000 family)